MKMVNLKKPAKSKMKLRKEMVETAPDYDEPKYPYGLEIHLETESINKLGIDIENSSVGDTVPIIAKAEIVRLSSNERLRKGKGKREESICLQITDMAYGFKAMK